MCAIPVQSMSHQVGKKANSFISGKTKVTWATERKTAYFLQVKSKTTHLTNKKKPHNPVQMPQFKMYVSASLFPIDQGNSNVYVL